MVFYTSRLRRVVPLCSSLIHHHFHTPKVIAPIRSIAPATSPANGNHQFETTGTSHGLQSFRLFSSRGRRFDEEKEITEDTILFEGCDYNHWLITVDFPENTPPEEKIATYERAAAQVFGSLEEAKKRIYACSTTVYNGFQVLCSEEVSEKFKDVPEVVFVLPDSYIDPVNKQYGGDKYVNGEIIPMPPPMNYMRRPSRPPRRDTFNPPQNPPYQQNFPPPQNPPHQQNFGRPQSPSHQQNFGPPQNPPHQPNFGPPRSPPHQPNFGPPQNAPYQQNFGPPQSPPQPNFGPPQQNFGPPQSPPQHNFGPPPSPPQHNFGPPQNAPHQHNFGPQHNPPYQQNFGHPQNPPHQQHFDPPQNPPHQQHFGPPPQNYGPQRGPVHQQNHPIPPNAPPPQHYGVQHDFSPQQGSGSPGKHFQSQPSPGGIGTGPWDHSGVGRTDFPQGGQAGYESGKSGSLNQSFEPSGSGSVGSK